mmetsp:Transcript_46000/g.127740  ORF Transcript_46000/g.127740 Transcript_46000/m.127740 type:complete len:193 (+) Transcript_46000:1671-2249(+)
MCLKSAPCPSPPINALGTGAAKGGLEGVRGGAKGGEDPAGGGAGRGRAAGGRVGVSGAGTRGWRSGGAGVVGTCSMGATLAPKPAEVAGGATAGCTEELSVAESSEEGDLSRGALVDEDVPLLSIEMPSVPKTSNATPKAAPSAIEHWASLFLERRREADSAEVVPSESSTQSSTLERLSSRTAGAPPGGDP